MICPQCRRPVTHRPSREHGIFELTCKCGALVTGRDDGPVRCPKCGREMSVEWPTKGKQ